MTMKILPFLSDLKLNNSKDWFDANRDSYTEARDEMIALVKNILEEMAPFEPQVAMLDPKKCIFRINRDVRFSKNKEPYKTALGAFMAPGGKSSGNGGYYIHFEPGNSFIGGGIYGPSPEVLKAIRQEIYFNGAQFHQIVQRKSFVDTFGELMYDKLKRPPKGYDTNFQYIDYLMFKNFVVSQPMLIEGLTNSEIVHKSKDIFIEMSDFVQFLNAAVLNSRDV